MRVAPLGAVLAAAACASLLTAGCATDPAPPSPQSGPQPAVATAAPGQSVPERQQAPLTTPVEGYAISIPKIDVTSDLVGLGLNPDRTVQVPPLDAPGQMGLYDRGPRPGADGPAVILGHVSGRDDEGRSVDGVFRRLGELEPRDRIDVTTPAGLSVFMVTDVITVDKEAFPTARVYSDTAGPELRLVTCGGVFDPASRNYEANVVVFAQQVS